MFVFRIAAALIGATLIGACSVVGGKAAPEPAFQVVTAAEPFEVREYPSLVLIKTSMDDGSNDAFGRLFDYISGNNGGDRKIAMTAPVLQSDKGLQISMTAPVLRSDDRQMAFILTEEFTAETAPLPNDPLVQLDVVPARKVAVISFSGRSNDSLYAEYLQKLWDWIATQGLTPTGPPELAQYNPPWTIPALRRNEVLIPIE